MKTPVRMVAFSGAIALFQAALTPMSAQATPPPVYQERIACETPVYAVDSLVCATPELMALETRMRALYPDDRQDAVPAADSLIERQGDWFWRRGACGTRPDAAACVKSAYQDRLEVVQAVRALPQPGLPVRCEGAPWGAGTVTLSRPTASAVVVRGQDRRALAAAIIGKPQSSWTPGLRVEDGQGSVRLVRHDGRAVTCTVVSG